MLFYSWFFISFIFSESETAVPRRNAKTIEAYMTYFESNQPDTAEITFDTSSLTTESFTHKKQRLIYNLYKNVLEKQREQREKNSKHTLIHRKRRHIENFEDEKITHNVTTKEMYLDLKIEKLTKIEITTELSKGISTLENENTRYNVTPINFSREIDKLKVKNTRNTTKIELYREIDKTTDNVTSKGVLRRMYIPMRLAGARNNTSNYKLPSKISLRQLNTQTENAKGNSKNALDKVIRLRSVNLTTARKKSTLKLARPYETIKEMIRYKRRSLIERRLLQQQN